MQNVFADFQPDRVIHVATYPNAKMVARNVLDATNNMVTATAYILDLCVQHKVEKIVFSTNMAGSTGAGDTVKFEVKLDGTFTSGTDIIYPIQLNRTRKQVSNADLYGNNDNSLVMTTVGTNEIADVRLSHGQTTAFIFFSDSGSIRSFSTS